VSLVDEARFDVGPQTHQPFVVQTGAVTTRVLGTLFAVRYTADEPFTQVTVFNGRVAIGGRGTPTVLDAGMTGRATDSTAAPVLTTEPGTYTDWPHSQLVFRSVPVPSALATLGRWTGYEFRLADSGLVSQHVTATFDVGDTHDMLPLLKRLLGVEMKINGNVVTLQRSKATEASRSPAVPERDVNPFPTMREAGR